jgi:hypothetical protein
MKKLVAAIFIIVIAGCYENKEKEQLKKEIMGKTLQPYRDYDASALIARSSSGISDMVVSGTNVEVTNIKISGVKSVLSESSNDLVSLCSSSKVNKYSEFSPYTRYISGGVFYNVLKSNYSLGDFGGYNHNALKAGWQNQIANPISFGFNAAMGTVNVPFKIDIGELNYSALGATHLKITLKYSGTLLASELFNFSLLQDIHLTTLEVNVSSWNATRALTGYLYLSNANGDELALFPNTEAWTITATKLNNASSTLFGGSDLGVVGTSTINQTTRAYTINISSISEIAEEGEPNYLGAINITAYVYREGEVIATQNVVSSSTLRAFSGTISTSLTYGDIVEFRVSI